MGGFTDCERREVARRLRGGGGPVHTGGIFYAPETLFGLSLSATSRHRLRMGLRSIADLIDPDTTSDGTSDGTETGETGPSASPVDRDALLALADEMDGRLLPRDCETCGIRHRCHGDRDCANILLVNYARRIRDACGIKEGRR